MPDKSIFVIEACALVLLFYFCYIQLRRVKYIKIAEELRAEYQSQGLFCREIEK
jgi:hypothetical protein